MIRPPATRLIARALCELVRYDLVGTLFGFRRVHRELNRLGVAAVSAHAETEAAICDAVEWATLFYWKPVRCLQRSIATVRALRRHGVAAQCVIGYRAQPFFGHAWVEVNGRVVNDSPAYQETLQILDRL
jgi:hypothetical protein